MVSSQVRHLLLYAPVVAGGTAICTLGKEGWEQAAIYDEARKWLAHNSFGDSFFEATCRLGGKSAGHFL